MRILVVEDDPLVREFVVDALREAGFFVIHAADGEEALAWFARKAADVLVTDIRLPGKVDGWQIAERCREHNPRLPVIYATGFSPVPSRPVAHSVLLRKPFHPADIVRAVREATQALNPHLSGQCAGDCRTKDPRQTLSLLQEQMPETPRKDAHTHTGKHRDVVFSLVKASGDQWRFAFAIGSENFTGRVQGRLCLLAIRRVRERIDRALRTSDAGQDSGDVFPPSALRRPERRHE